MADVIGTFISRSVQSTGLENAAAIPALQAGGHRFDPGTLHRSKKRKCAWLSDFSDICRSCRVSADVRWNPLFSGIYWRETGAHRA